ncbi:hypothetical protein CLOM_g21917 [Closterium sp. NIES-68]|nr:hypothetical protein CLOM_g21917 [Closterium sp. NIES-68]
MECERQTTRGDSWRDPRHSSSDDDSMHDAATNDPSACDAVDGPAGNLPRSEGGQRAGDGNGGARERENKLGWNPRGGGAPRPRRSKGAQFPQAAATAAVAECVSGANAASPPLPPLDAMGGAASRHVRAVEDAALWHACAGPLVTVPGVGSLVAYFPQGHAEQQQRLAQRDPPMLEESESPSYSPPGLSSPIAIAVSDSQSHLRSHDSGDDSPSPSHGDSGLSQSPSQSESSGCTLRAQGSGSPGARGGTEGARGMRQQQLPPSHMFCRLTAVTLQADERTHELMVRFELQPVHEAEAARVQAAASYEARKAGAGGKRGQEHGRRGEEGEGKEQEAEEGEEEGGTEMDGAVEQVPRQAGLQAGVHTNVALHARLHMCCKRLSSSDAAPHGGFFIPCKAAESLFPALNANEEGPCQQLVASDVFGRDWNFRHVYRGSPRRHLLTAGWSALCASWGLAASDRIVFLRAGNGALKVGTRRSEAVVAAQQRRQRERERERGRLAVDAACSTGTVNGEQDRGGAEGCGCGVGSAGAGTAAAGAAAASGGGGAVEPKQVLDWAAHCHHEKRPFSVVYHPCLAATPAPFIVPLGSFCAALRLKQRLAPATEVRMAFETDELAVHRLRGTVTAVHRAVSGVWPTSQWRSVRVRWFDCDPALPKPPLRPAAHQPGGVAAVARAGWRDVVRLDSAWKLSALAGGKGPATSAEAPSEAAEASEASEASASASASARLSPAASSAAVASESQQQQQRVPAAPPLSHSIPPTMAAPLRPSHSHSRLPSLPLIHAPSPSHSGISSGHSAATQAHAGATMPQPPAAAAGGRESSRAATTPRHSGGVLAAAGAPSGSGVRKRVRFQLSLTSLLPCTSCHVAANSSGERPAKKARSAARDVRWQSGDVEGRAEEGGEVDGEEDNGGCEERVVCDEGEADEGRKDEEEREEDEGMEEGRSEEEEGREGEEGRQGGAEGVTCDNRHSSFEAAAVSLLVLKQGGQHSAPPPPAPPAAAPAALAAPAAPTAQTAMQQPAVSSCLTLSLSPSSPPPAHRSTEPLASGASGASDASGWCDPLALSLTPSPHLPHTWRIQQQQQQGGAGGNAVAHGRHDVAQGVHYVARGVHDVARGMHEVAQDMATHPEGGSAVGPQEEVPETPRQGGEGMRGVAMYSCDEAIGEGSRESEARASAAALGRAAAGEALQPSAHGAAFAPGVATGAAVGKATGVAGGPGAAGGMRRIKLRMEGSPVGRTVDLSGLAGFQSLYAMCAAMLQLPLQQPCANVASEVTQTPLLEISQRTSAFLKCNTTLEEDRNGYASQRRLHKGTDKEREGT